MTTQGPEISFRDTLMEVSRKVDTLTTLVARHIEQMINHQDGMDRLGRQKDEHEKRIRDLEIQQAQQAISRQQNSSSDAIEERTRSLEISQAANRWIERVVWLGITIAAAIFTAKLTGGTVP